jgi:hypothetical protein
VSVGDVRELVDRLAEVITVTGGRRAGDPETRVHLDHLIPPPGALPSGPGHWRLATSEQHFYPPPVSREPLRAWHAADGAKGRRLVATDLRTQSRVAALLSWHFEPRGRRPHLVTSAALRSGISDSVRVDYLVALWLLLCAALAIDRLTIERSHIGLVLDNAIELGRAELDDLGLVRGSARRGYAGSYFVFEERLR